MALRLWVPATENAMVCVCAKGVCVCVDGGPGRLACVCVGGGMRVCVCVKR